MRDTIYGEIISEISEVVFLFDGDGRFLFSAHTTVVGHHTHHVWEASASHGGSFRCLPREVGSRVVIKDGGVVKDGGVREAVRKIHFQSKNSKKGGEGGEPLCQMGLYNCAVNISH